MGRNISGQFEEKNEDRRPSSGSKEQKIRPVGEEKTGDDIDCQNMPTTTSSTAMKTAIKSARADETMASPFAASQQQQKQPLN